MTASRSGSSKEKSLLLITRAINDADKFIKKLPLSDQTVLPFPLYEYEYFDELSSSLKPQNFEYVVVTSSQSLPFLIKHKSIFQRCSFLCVGFKTSERLEDHGFNVVEKAATAKDLSKILRKPIAQKYLYVRGREISFDFKTFIQQKGGSCEEVIAYGTVPASRLPENLKEKILLSEELIITLFSSRAAEILENLLLIEGMSAVRTRTKVLSISSRVIKSLKQTDWQEMYVCETPDVNSMYALIQQIRKRKTLRNSDNEYR
ncbi:MAG: hypothetical protein CL565_01310 [Alphaproteobacteria bacterium]|nr:hypothetical protein [Alphaproteobacteria bacterium]|tara:strand:- start:80 stop:862 length:783 start_codon:yes stop_codon:yes gene_type:complete